MKHTHLSSNENSGEYPSEIQVPGYTHAMKKRDEMKSDDENVIMPKSDIGLTIVKLVMV